MCSINFDERVEKTKAFFSVPSPSFALPIHLAFPLFRLLSPLLPFSFPFSLVFFPLMPPPFPPLSLLLPISPFNPSLSLTSYSFPFLPLVLLALPLCTFSSSSSSSAVPYPPFHSPVDSLGNNSPKCCTYHTVFLL